MKADGAWHDLELKPTDIAGGEHWGGPNDGKWRGPLARLALMLSTAADPNGKTPALDLADVRAEVVRPVFAAPPAFAADFAADKLPAGWAVEGAATADPKAGLPYAAFAKLTGDEVNALTPQMQFNVPTISCKQLDDRPNGAIDRVDSQVVACYQGARILLDKASVVGDDIANAKVTATVTAQDRGAKTIVFKFKRKKQYKRTYGHRQNYTELTINDVVV